MNAKSKGATFVDGHPEENDLFLALERELPPEEFEEIEKHLGGCWSCRARFDEMQHGILAFIEYRENRYLPSLEGPPNAFRNFPEKLRRLVDDDAPGLLTHLRKSFATLFALPAYVRWSTAIAIITVIAVLWSQVFNPTMVSANELLTRAIAAQSPSGWAKGEGGKRRNIRQKVQIRNGSRAVVRDFEWTAREPMQHTRWEITEDPSRWDSPLTGLGFAEWRESLPAKDDRVERSQDELRLTTTTETGPIKKASIMVRAADFHPLEQHIVFADQQTLDFIELGFEVADKPAPLVTQSPIQGPSLTLEPNGKTRNLDEIELAVRYKLFREDLDLGEDLQIEQAGNEVMVSGVASSKEHADAIKLLLTGLEGVRLRVSFPQAAKASNVPADLSRSNSTEGHITPETPLAEALLSKEFPSSNERTYFVNAWLAASDKALSHAWALKRLAERYTKEEESRLTPKSADKLREMLRIHLEAVGQANADLDSFFKLLPDSANSASPAATDLRSGIMQLFGDVQEQDSLIAKLIAGAPAGGQDLATASRRLRASHRAVQILSVSLRDLL